MEYLRDCGLIQRWVPCSRESVFFQTSICESNRLIQIIRSSAITKCLTVKLVTPGQKKEVDLYRKSEKSSVELFQMEIMGEED